MAKRGPLAMQRRMNWPVGLVAMLLSRLCGDKDSKMADFMPYEQSIQDFAKAMKDF